MAGASGNPKSPVWYGGGLASVMLPGAGKVFYVNGGSDGPANDAYDGTRPDRPKRTLQAAIDLCTSNNNDYVIVLNYGGNARAVEAWPVEVNKDLIHIIGVGTISNKWPVVSVLAPAAGDTANCALYVTGQRVEIAGLEIGGGNTAGCIHVGTVGGVWATWIHDCWFGVTGDGVGQDGVVVPAGTDAPFLTVTDCEFSHYITQHGVFVVGNATRCSIGKPGHGNIFNQVPGIAINMNGGVTEPKIFDNRIAITANTAGAGITLAAGVLDAYVDGNRANFGDTDMANDPFSDAAGAGANNWGLNYQGITADLPS